MAVKYPIAYELSPQRTAKGSRWLSVRLRNVGSEELTELDVNLHSLDTYNLSVAGSGKLVPRLLPETEERLDFRVVATATNSLYITIDGFREGEPFHWESPDLWVRIGEETAELASIFAVTEPYLKQHQSVRCRVTVRGLAPSEGLRLEVAADTPSGEVEELAVVSTRPLEAGDVDQYEFDVTVEERGAYTLYAYLYEGERRIGRKVEHVYVT
jgi:hypothetical protein